MNEITRLRFLKWLLAGVVFAPGIAVLGRSLDNLRGDRVGWARLKTRSPIWMRHARSDPKLTQFFRDCTTLNIDSAWYAADVERLEEMCKYPLLFSQDIRPAQNGDARNNLVEYIRRGGFLLIDSCINPGSRGDANVFIAQHSSAFTEMLPEARVSLLPDDHELFHCYFQHQRPAMRLGQHEAAAWPRRHLHADAGEHLHLRHDAGRLKSSGP